MQCRLSGAYIIVYRFGGGLSRSHGEYDRGGAGYGVSAGAAVAFVAEGSCAQEAGLQVNDIIIAIDDTAVDSPSALTAALSSDYKAGDTATLTVVRQQQEIKLTITFDEKNAETEAANQLPQNQNQQNSGGNQNYYYQFPFGSFFW